jgi:hypothetical protein
MWSVALHIKLAISIEQNNEDQGVCGHFTEYNIWTKEKWRKRRLEKVHDKELDDSKS